jgi:aminocarboxymuconate-semialdehyde decarboxylase
LPRLPHALHRLAEEEADRVLAPDVLRSIVFTPEALRHLAAEAGPGQIVMGTDYPYPWTSTSVDHILTAPGFTDAERAAMLGDTAAKLLQI